MRDAAKTLGVTEHVIHDPIESGALPAEQMMPDARREFRVAELPAPAVKHD
jgi:hypothetical protein